ncbi:MAG: KAP family P-loop NTPase fold protein, partial [Ktedonobacterales bacterium]
MSRSSIALFLSWLLVGLICGNALWNLVHLPQRTLDQVATALALPGKFATAGIPLWACGVILALMVVLVMWCIAATRRGVVPGTSARFEEHVRTRYGAVVFVAPVALVGAGVVIAAVVRLIDRLIASSSSNGVLAIAGKILQGEALSAIIPLVLLAAAFILLVRQPRHATRHTPRGRNEDSDQLSPAPYLLLSDTCRDATGRYKDLLGYTSFVRTIAAAILGTKDPSLAISLEAEAGSGKTTAMRLIKQALEDDGQCLTIWFDAWRYSAADVQRAFLSMVVTAIDAPALRIYLQSKRKEVAKTLVDVVGRAKQMGDVGTLIAGAFDFEARYRNVFEQDFRTLLNHWAREKRTEQLVVIFIDDLDRCLPQATTQVFEAMKLFSDTPGCVFVYGFNPDEVVRRILIEYRRYVLDGRDHLSKFVQSSYQLPPPNHAVMKQFIHSQVEKAKLTEFFASDALRGYVDRILQVTRHNPRKIKNALNILSLRIPNTRPEDYAALIELVVLFQYE